MAEGPSPDESETLTLSTAQAETCSVAWRKKSVATAVIDDIKAIPFTLLSSGDIKKVVLATGAISPFYENGGRRSRLKKASYEGRVGSKAFEYRNLKRIHAFNRYFDLPFVKDKFDLVEIYNSEKNSGLVVPRNGIVFVETDLEFRLPDFLALRFNLQIKHVHRGLLLGTGPLVDPGFLGKLCIPLHNLTDEDYYIGQNDGLIWVEFTKTSIPADQDDPARAPLEGNVFQNDIRTLIKKAAYRYPNEEIAIRSSLPGMFDQATESARKAEVAAKRIAALNVLGIIGAVVAICGLIFTASNFMSGLSKRNEDAFNVAKQSGDDLVTKNKELERRVEILERSLGNSRKLRTQQQDLLGH